MFDSSKIRSNMPTLEQHFTVRAYLGKETVQLKGIKSGPTRFIISITDGFVKGKGLEAEIIGGGDWLLVSSAALVKSIIFMYAAQPYDKHRSPERPHSSPHFIWKLHLHSLSWYYAGRRCVREGNITGAGCKDHGLR
jgi:hypothetical protein